MTNFSTDLILNIFSFIEFDDYIFFSKELKDIYIKKKINSFLLGNVTKNSCGHKYLKCRERLMVWFNKTDNSITGIRLCPACFTYTMDKNKEILGRYSIVMDKITIYETLNNMRKISYLEWIKCDRHHYICNATSEELDNEINKKIKK
jgi:hypothetical protein